MKWFIFSLSLVLVSACQAQPNDSAPSNTTTPDSVYTEGRRSYDGIGKYFLGREISQVMGHLGAGWLERDSREGEERPDLLIDTLASLLSPDATVADIGAGTGYMSFRLAPRVPQGRVFAVDIQPEMLDLLAQGQRENGITNVIGHQGSIQDPLLPTDTLDMVFMVDVYHEFSHPHEMMTALYEDLKPGGYAVLVEYRGEDPSVPIKPRHKMTEAQARKELEYLGFEFVRNYRMLPRQHVLVFAKPSE